MTIRDRALVYLFATCLAGTWPAVAQVPDGYFVTAHAGTPVLGPGGLFTFHPRSGAWTAVAGLPADLTGSGIPYQAGASAVAILPDGTLAVGQLTANGATLYLHHLALVQGTAVVLRKIPLGVGTGTATNKAVITEIEVLAPDTVLVAACTLGGGVLGPPGPLANHQLGIVTLRTSTVRPCPMSPMPIGIANAVTGDGRWAYVAMFDGTTSQTDLWKVDCAQPPLVPPQLLNSLPQTKITNLELDGAGQLLATSGGPFYTFDATSGAILAQCPYGGGIAFATEGVTGLVAGVYGRTTQQDVWLWTPPCVLPKTVITRPPAGGWGIPQGIDVAHDPVA